MTPPPSWPDGWPSFWDLLGLVILGGLLSAVYQGRHRALSAHQVRIGLLTAIVAVALAALMTWPR